MSIDRRTFLATLGAATVVGPHLMEAMAPRRARPSAQQLLWQRDELALFLHFGINTFTDREWGDGREDPARFDPTGLDVRQWARVAREAGFKAMILTAKHHDGFCLWPTCTTKHSVASSPWRDGKGDLVREFVEACRAEDLRVGLYCSPWDRNHPSYGDSPRYRDVYAVQLTELLTDYGEIHEVWFDGANGEGPNGKLQEYDWPTTWKLVRKLQPKAVIFSDAGPDVRWIGNERGVAGETNWSTVDPTIVPVPGMTGDEVMRSLTEGDRGGTVWRPGETDVSIRPGWFYHAKEDARVRTAEDLVDLYFTSVGRNSKLLLNVPPTAAGVLHPRDVESLRGMRAKLEALFAIDLAAGRRVQWRRTSARSGVASVQLAAPVTVAVLDLRERIADGQRVAGYTVEGRVEGAWRELSHGSTIGYRRLTRWDPVTLDAIRVTVTDAVEPPLPLELRLF
ncbi:MAG: alpha-L-fucosidase [Gemmatimonadota bacterium]